MKKIVVLGAGESGTGAAILAKEKGYHVFVSDASTIKEAYKSELNTLKIPWEEGQHTTSLILEADEIVKSPGIPNSIPLLKAAKERGITIISEIEFAGRYTDAKMICITGSNGKTTTTSLLYHILKESGLKVGVAGNIGYSLARQILKEECDYYVVELSSFQLDNMYQFKADIAILLNITPDHLDRYEYVFQNYIDSKFRVVQNQSKAEKFIFWNDDPIIQKELSKRAITASLYPFCIENPSIEQASYSNTDALVIDNGKLSIKRDSLTLKGVHNLLNAIAATTAAYLIGLNENQIEQGLSSFKGVEHRLEYVDTIDGITYINDSKATNIDSCYYALQAMTDKTILIIGGKDKGNDYNTISHLISDKCKALVFLGADNRKLIDFFKDFSIPYYSTNKMKDAVEKAHHIASDGETILLSPCCASFDLFSSYEERGKCFKEIVKQLKHGSNSETV